jgi:hypothetical protein
MITTSIIVVITLVSATAVAGLVTLWVDYLDRRSHLGELASQGLASQGEADKLGS